MQSDLQPFDNEMKEVIALLEEELKMIRVGRANPDILKGITVDYYGTPTPIEQVANISVPEARMIQIQPWESSILNGIVKAINQANIGLTPNDDGKVIRLVFPELTEERRVEVARDVSALGEDAKVKVRNVRRDAMDFVKEQEKSGEISEDFLHTMEKEIQELTDKFTDLVDTKVEDKKEDVMSL